MQRMHAYVLPGAGAEDVVTWMEGHVGATIVRRLEDANIVVFTGGSDVDPALYGEDNVASSIDQARDKEEEQVFLYCRYQGIPMLGICRGSQFLHVMMGGKLWQDVSGHCCQHDLLDLETRKRVTDTTSTHHQMVRLAWTDGGDKDDNGFSLIAVPATPEQRSGRYMSADGGACLPGDEVVEAEAYRYPAALIVGIQGHPEWSTEPFQEWAAEKVKDLFNDSDVGKTQ